MTIQYRQYSNNILDVLAECGSYISDRGYRLPRTAWEPAGYGDAGDRRYNARLLTSDGKDAAIEAHFFDGSTTGHPFCHFHAYGKRTIDDWTPEIMRSTATPVQKFTSEEIAAMAERDRQQAERECEARLKAFEADLKAYYFDALPLNQADPAGEGVTYLRYKCVPLDLLPGVRVAIHAREPLPPVTSTAKPRGPYIPASALVVPYTDVRDSEQRITAFQWIMDKQRDDDTDKELPRGNGKKKRFRKDAKPKTLTPIVHWIGDPRGAQIVALAEGLATAATWYKLTGIPTGSTCDADQLEKTGKALLKTFSNALLIVVTDDDFVKTKAGLHHAQRVQEADPRRVYIALPPWPRHEMMHARLFGLTDWNDYYCHLIAIAGDQGAQMAQQAAALKVAAARRHFNLMR